MTTISRNDSEFRIEAHVDGELAGFVNYRESGDRITFIHTEVLPEHRGTDVATTLAHEAITDAVERDLTIVPECSYIARYLDRHDVPGARVETP